MTPYPMRFNAPVNTGPGAEGPPVSFYCDSPLPPGPHGWVEIDPWGAEDESDLEESSTWRQGRNGRTYTACRSCAGALAQDARFIPLDDEAVAAQTAERDN